MKKIFVIAIVVFSLFACSFSYAECDHCGSNSMVYINRPIEYIDDVIFDTHTEKYVVDMYCEVCGNMIGTTVPYTGNSYPHVWSGTYHTNIIYQNNATYHWKEGKLLKRCNDCQKTVVLVENERFDQENHYMSSTYMEDAGHIGVRHYYVVICGNEHCSRYYTISVPCRGGSTHSAPMGTNPIGGDSVTE